MQCKYLKEFIQQNDDSFLAISASFKASEVPDLLHFPISCCGIIALALSLDSLAILVLVKVLAKKCFISPAEIYGALSFTTWLDALGFWKPPVVSTPVPIAKPGIPFVNTGNIGEGNCSCCFFNCCFCCSFIVFRHFHRKPVSCIRSRRSCYVLCVTPVKKNWFEFEINLPLIYYN